MIEADLKMCDEWYTGEGLQFPRSTLSWGKVRLVFHSGDLTNSSRGSFL